MAILVLDTNAVIMSAVGGKMLTDGKEAIFEAAIGGTLFVSPVSAWEIGMLANRETGVRLGFVGSPIGFFQGLLDREGWNLLPLTVKAAIMSSRLPGDFHKDPGDRLLVASAIDAGATFVTRDAKILDWAARTGALKVLAI